MFATPACLDETIVPDDTDIWLEPSESLATVKDITTFINYFKAGLAIMVLSIVIARVCMFIMLIML